jgi:hypothetical protein
VRETGASVHASEADAAAERHASART